MVARTSWRFHVLPQALTPFESTSRSRSHTVRWHDKRKSESDVDLVIAGRVTLEDVLGSAGELERSLGRAIHPTIYSFADFQGEARRQEITF